jgi:YD repeat-containing protein
MTSEEKRCPFDFVVAKDRGGHVTRRLLDADRVAWVDECSNTVPPGTSNPDDLVCDTPDRTFYSYHPTGELTAIYDATEDYTGANHRLAYAYDTLGRVIEIDDPDGGTSYTTYDLVGNVETITNARGRTTEYEYDDLDRLTSIDFNGGNPHFGFITFTYDSHTRQRNKMQHGPGVSISYTYDDFGRETRNVLSI